MAEEWIVNSDHTKKMFMDHVERLYDEHKYVTFSFKTGKQRSKAQNRALHKYLSMLSAALNDAGLDVRKTLRQDIEVPWDKEGRLAKEHLWGPIQKAVTGHDSSTKPEKGQYTEIYETLNRYTSQRLGVSLPWPNKNDMV